MQVRAVLAALGLALLAGCASGPRSFSDPEAAAKALVYAVDAGDQQQLREILGPDAEDLLSSGDSVADRQEARRFVEAWDTRHTITTEEDGSRTLVVGAKEWPVPFPIVKGRGGWHFDAERGADEILNRRIGRNELDAIQVCLAIADAQTEYARMDIAGDGLHEYARRILSDPGTKNGLYWEAGPGERPSPMGQLVAHAEDEGYGGSRDAQGHAAPYHGYRYRLLTAQGENAPGGAHDYLANGRMIGGFAVVAWPARYGNSGVMTFMVSHDGEVWQCDLEDETESVCKNLKTFDPGAGWTKVDASAVDATP